MNNTVEKVLYPVLFVIGVYVEGWLLGGDRSLWWSFPSHIIACAGVLLSAAMSCKAYIGE